MIKVLINEYVEGNLAIRDTIITFFFIPIFKYRKSSTNNVVIKQFMPIENRKIIKGFSDEIKNKN